jgi:hypothetical protein
MARPYDPRALNTEKRVPQCFHHTRRTETTSTTPCTRTVMQTSLQRHPTQRNYQRTIISVPHFVKDDAPSCTKWDERDLFDDATAVQVRRTPTQPTHSRTHTHIPTHAQSFACTPPAPPKRRTSSAARWQHTQCCCPGGRGQRSRTSWFLAVRHRARRGEATATRNRGEQTQRRPSSRGNVSLPLSRPIMFGEALSRKCVKCVVFLMIKNATLSMLKARPSGPSYASVELWTRWCTHE